MKKIINLGFLYFLLSPAYSQTDSLKLKDLAVPNSPAFVIADITPSLIQTPNTPKKFILGLAQSYQQSTDGFPQNYSAEFCPYWWFNQSNRNVYSLVGLKTKKQNGFVTSTEGQDPFSGLKFTSISIAFLSKDLIPDTINTNQKIFSIGVKTTLIKLQLKKNTESLNRNIVEWHNKAFDEIPVELQTRLAKYDDNPDSLKKITKEIEERKKQLRSKRTVDIVKEINSLMNEKPIFCWDIAAAHATYGIGDSAWKTGRSGIWTTLSSYIPLAISEQGDSKNYLSLNFAFRYLVDNYFKNEKNSLSRSHSVDVGGKIAFELGDLSVGIESLYRYNNGQSNKQNRTVGIINYKITNNVCLNGAFGKNFDLPNKLVALFGINWGIGSEFISLPK